MTTGLRRGDPAEHQRLTVRQAQMLNVLELFRDGHSTMAIADRVGICEREVCRMLEEVRAC